MHAGGFLVVGAAAAATINVVVPSSWLQSLAGNFLRYVKEGLRPFLLAAGVLLIATAVVTIWYDLRTAHARRPDGHDDHGHAHHEPQVGWLLILPVLGLLLIAPPALGSYSATQPGSALTAPSDSDYPPLPAGDPAPISLLDYASRAVYVSGKSLIGRTVRMSGFITRGPDGRPMLARIVLTCCAADGRPIKVGFAGNVTIDAASDSWVQVDGVYSSQVGKDPVNKADIAYVEVKPWQEITEPKQPYD